MDNTKKQKGIIVMNLGTPETTKVSDVKKYLDEFLMDKKVMDYSYLFRWFLVRQLITPRRAPKTAEAYQSVWWSEGSPLMVISERVRSALEKESGLPVEIAMRYGNPSPKRAFDRLLEEMPDLEEVILLPLYPHYAMSSFETAADYAFKAYKKGNYSFKLTAFRPFFDDPHYIHVLADSIRPYLKSTTDYLLFSFHGVPVRHIKKGDITGHHCLQTPDCCTTPSLAHSYCYRHQVYKTAQLTAKALGLEKEQYGVSFQSRLGKAEWLQPYTSETLSNLPQKGVKNLVVTSPAFTTDCLETLEEMAIEGKETFIEAGGENYDVTACLNDNPAWIEVLAQWVMDYFNGDPTMVFEGKKASPVEAPV